MVEELAVRYFRGAEGYNCAQAVAKCFAAGAEQIGTLAACGGGRAEGGLCGALHAAVTLLPSPEAKAAIQDAFAQKAGALTCRAIRQQGRLSCPDCVRTAAGLASDHGLQ